MSILPAYERFKNKARYTSSSFKKENLVTVEDKNNFIDSVFKSYEIETDLEDYNEEAVEIICRMRVDNPETDEEYKNRLNLYKRSLESTLKNVETTTESLNQINQILEKLNNK